MKILVQWAAALNPQDWSEYPSSDWALLPSQPIAALCVQGMVFAADRYAVQDLPDGGVIVLAEVDGPLSGQRLRVVHFKPLKPDAALGGAYNTDVSKLVYTDQPYPTTVRTTVLPWAQRISPNVVWRDGKLMNDALWNAHQQALTRRPWREWTEGVPAEFIRDGKLVDQRRRGRYLPSQHTRTYYHNNVSRLNGVVTATFELALQAVPTGASNISSDQITAAGVLLAIGTSDSGEPDHVTWPTGQYRYQIDCLTANSDVTYGLLQLGSTPKDGGFWRVNSGLTTQVELHHQVEAAFGDPGIQLATYVGSWTTPGAQSDRFCISVAADRPTGHGSANITLELGEADDFADGAWSGTSQEDACFFGGGV